MTDPKVDSVPVAMYVRNAGLVLLQGFVPTLFSRLGLVADQQFVTPDARRRAVHLLQYLATGRQQTAEEYLTLNKIFCGLSPQDCVETGIEISVSEHEICESLLNAVIGYWDAIGDSSIEGFRGNWLIRNGALGETADHWTLVVERRAYDLLLARAPFSYSVIKFPWMAQAIYVTWPT